MYQALWIIGERALEGFCLKRFGERPHFTETIGHCGNATIWLSYKRTPNDGFFACYLIFMPHDRGDYTYNQLEEKFLEHYEQITAYRNTVQNGWGGSLYRKQ